MTDIEPDQYDEAADVGASKRRLISVALLPSAATLGNLLCGFLAMMCALLEMRAAYFEGASDARHSHLEAWFPTYIAVGAYLVVLAMIFDALDGRLARITRHTTEFGAQLDSIADIVSFGVAPAILLLSLLLPLAVPAQGEVIVGKLEWRVGLLGALVYVSCAAIRLARYNAENIEGEGAQSRFNGLPTPGGAGAMAALLLLHSDLVRDQAALFGIELGDALRCCLGAAAFLLGILMVSGLNYVHVFNEYVRREHPPIHLVGFVILVAIGFYSPQILLAVLAAGYVLSGVLLQFKTKRRNAPDKP